MNFLIIEQTDGGMDVTNADYQGAAYYLHKYRKYWGNAAKAFMAHDWKVGEWMDYPCGIIACVQGEAIV